MDDRKQAQEQRALDVMSDHFTHTLHIMLAIIIVIATLLMAAIGVIVYEVEARVELERDIVPFETYEYDIDQEADDDSANYFVGRDYYGGEAARTRKGDEGQDP